MKAENLIRGIEQRKRNSNWTEQDTSGEEEFDDTKEDTTDTEMADLKVESDDSGRGEDDDGDISRTSTPFDPNHLKALRRVTEQRLSRMNVDEVSLNSGQSH